MSIPASSSLPTVETEILDIVTPGAGESVTEGEILEWHVQVGDTVEADETIVEISTDKVDVELPAPAAGTIVELLAAEGDTVTVGQTIARLQPAAVGASTAEDAAPPAPPEPAATAPEPVAPCPAGAIPIKGAAAMLARAMSESLEIPTATSFRTITVTVLDGRRQQLKAGGQRVSFTHLIAYAVAKAATDDLPVMAHRFEVLDRKPTRIDAQAVNLGIAVDVEKKDGTRTLMVPVIRDAGRLDFRAFLAAFDDLIARARENRLTVDDLVGANVSLTNPGGLGTVASVPRLMAGQGTIVATGSIAYPGGIGTIGALIGAEKVMSMTSTYDHRIIQGAESGRFLQIVEGYLQGEHGFYDQVFADLGVDLGPVPAPPAPAAAARAAAPDTTAAPATDDDLLQAVQSATSIVRAFRTHGHLAARLDPLGTPPDGDPSLDPEPLGLTDELQQRVPANILRIGVPGATLHDALPHLRETYTGTIAYEIEHIASHDQRTWLREKIETGAYRAPLTNDERQHLLERLIDVDAFERFMHKAYLGQTIFSIEGLDMTVPMLDELFHLAAAHGGREVIVGMAHRGRLNVLAHNLGRSYEALFAEFEGASTLEAVTTIPQDGTGDVKYHLGARGTFPVDNGESIIVDLQSNPSHLEIVDPVVVGAVRAAQTTRQGPHAHRDTSAAIPVILHGDAAFPGQGVVAETLNLQGLTGYTVGGTVHIITNNQVGYTTDPDQGRSTRWSSDLAKGFDVPIIHVNADDPAACISAIRLAFAFRLEFGRDALIDLVGYRRYGHNEADEPSYTQPEMYALIKKHPRVCDLWAEQLVSDGLLAAADVDARKQETWANLAGRHKDLKDRIAAASQAGQVEQATGEFQLDRSRSPDAPTAVDAGQLRTLNEELVAVPDGFTVHPKMVKQLERRRHTLGAEGGIDWAQAESLAFASLIADGVPVRLTGQDTERGTFSQRHLVLHDAKTGQAVSPIQQLPSAAAPFELHNSPLSEVACLGFEYGYAKGAPEALVLWEAQFGDFVNGAQVVIDQFLTSGLAKWGETTRLTLLLPHGYEGSGPEHSSGRLERFLQLAAEGNIRVANPSTPAQYFHLLRRQALRAKPRPLVVMTPKSLLRLPQATSRIEHLADTRFFSVLGEPRVDPAKVRLLILCTGKVYYDLVHHERRAGNDEIAVGRVELLYPFPESEIRELIGQYPNLEEVVWVQEEPRNMGARAHMSARILQILPEHVRFGYIGRPERASPGEGYPVSHATEQRRIIETALAHELPATQFPRKTPGER